MTKKLFVFNHPKIQDFELVTTLIDAIKQEFPDLAFLLTDNKNTNRLARRYARLHGGTVIDCSDPIAAIQEADLTLAIYPDKSAAVALVNRDRGK